MGATREHPYPLGLELDRAHELEHEPRFSEAGLAEYRDHARLPFVDRLAHHLDESVQLGLAADHARLDALHTARGEAEPLPLGARTV